MLSGWTVGDIAIIIVCLLVSMTVHEFMHAYVGHLLGDETAFDGGRVSFNPLRHIDPFMTVVLPIVTLVVFHSPLMAAKPVPFNPDRVRFGVYGAALLAAAGPLSNLVMALMGAIVVRITTIGTLQNAIDYFVQLNVVLFVFNLVPIPPLDGSRILYAFAPEPLQDFMEQIEPYGLFIVFALVILGVGNYLVSLDNFVLNLLP